MKKNIIALLVIIYLAIGYIPMLTSVIILIVTAFRFAFFANDNWLFVDTFVRFAALLIMSMVLFGIVATTQQSLYDYLLKQKSK